MASSPANCPKHETVPEQPTQTKKCSQGKRGKMKATSKAQGWQNGAEDIVPSPVDWEPVDDVDGPAYMNYKVIIEKERTPDLFPAAKGTMNVSKHHSLCTYRHSLSSLQFHAAFSQCLGSHEAPHRAQNM